MNGKMIVASAAACLLLSGCSEKPRPIVVGAMNTTEQSILGEIVAQRLEKRLGLPVERRMKMDGAEILHEALIAGQVDVYPEYAGEALVTALKVDPGDDPVVADARLQREYAALHLEWMSPLGFHTGFVMVMRTEDARASRIESLTDAVARGSEWTIAVTPEFMARVDGYAALMRTYPLYLSGGARPMGPSLVYTALREKQANMAVGKATDVALSSGGLTILRDDRRVFPMLGAALAVRAAALTERPGMREALQGLLGKIPDDVMRRLNREVETRGRSPRDVAADFLRSAGL
jgi:osmoprotectant transport system substrate-binding protein